MEIELHPKFKKSYKIRIAKNSELVVRTAKRLKLFQTNPQSPIFKDHLLKGRKRNFRAFWGNRGHTYCLHKDFRG